MSNDIVRDVYIAHLETIQAETNPLIIKTIRLALQMQKTSLVNLVFGKLEQIRLREDFADLPYIRFKREDFERVKKDVM